MANTSTQIPSLFEGIEKKMEDVYKRFPDLNPSSLSYNREKEMKIVYNGVYYTVEDFIGCSNGLSDHRGVYSYIVGDHREFIMISRDDYTPISNKEVYAVGYAYLKKISGLAKLEDQKKALLESIK